MPEVSRRTATRGGGDHGPVAERSEDLDPDAVDFLTSAYVRAVQPVRGGGPGRRGHP
ncbi:hypothetical protein [Streptomyces sp. NPDC003393]